MMGTTAIVFISATVITAIVAEFVIRIIKVTRIPAGGPLETRIEELEEDLAETEARLQDLQVRLQALEQNTAAPAPAAD